MLSFFQPFFFHFESNSSFFFLFISIANNPPSALSFLLLIAFPFALSYFIFPELNFALFSLW